MAAPVVQGLDEILASLQPGYAQQEALYNQQAAAIPGQTQAITQGLEAGKQNAFRDINNLAAGQGQAFSGAPVAEQYRYVGEKFMPAVAGVQADAMKQQNDIAMQLAGLQTEKRNTAVKTQADQQSAASAYQQAETERMWKERQAELDRQLERQKIAASSAGSPPAQWQVKQADIGALSQALKSKTGKDGFVSPDTYLRAKQEWVNAGYGADEFDKVYSNYRNPQNRYYKVG